jgi:hypothetical protein
MLGIKFIKVEPTSFVMQFKRGKIVREGAGLSFMYFAPNSSLVLVPIGIAAATTGKKLETTDKDKKSFDWDADFLYFSVREPWPSKTSGAGITFGQITAATPLFLMSQMPENGVIFSDGIEADYLQFNSGTLATITVAEKKGMLVK